MPSCNNILVIIAVRIILTQGMPPNIGKGSYTYDPDSISQNEKILRLFLNLATGTANHLIRLKKEAKLCQEATPQVSKNELAVRISLPDEIPGRGNGEHENSERKGRPMYPYGRELDEKESEDQPDLRVPSQQESEISPKKENHQEILPKPEFSKNLSIKLDMLEGSVDNTTQEKQSNEKPMPSSKSEDKLDESSEGTQKTITAENSTDLPMEIESRMLSNVQNHDQINDKEYSNATSDADTIASSNSSHQQETGQVSKTEPVISSEFPGHVQDEVSRLNSEDSGSLTEKPVNESLSAINEIEHEASSTGSNETIHAPQRSNGQSGNSAAGMFHQDSETGSNFQSESREIMNTTRELASNQLSGNGSAEDVHQDSTSTSKPESKSTEVMNPAQGLVPVEQSRNESAVISNQDLEGTSSLQFGSKGKTNAAEGLGSNGQSENQAAGIVHQASGIASNLQSESSGIVDADQGLTSNIQTGNQAPGIAQVALGGGSSLQSGPSRSLNTGQELVSSRKRGNQTVVIAHPARNLESGSSEIVNAAQRWTLNSQNGNQAAEGELQASGTVSNLQSGSSSLINATQGLPSTALGGHQTVVIGDQALGVAPDLKSGSSRIINAVTSMTSNGQSRNQYKNIVHQAGNVEFNVEPSAEKFSTLQNPDANVLNKMVSTVNGNDSNQMIKSKSENAVSKNPEQDGLSGVLDPAKSGGFLSVSGSVLTNQGSSLLSNSNQALSALTVMGNRTSGTLIQATDAIGSSVHRENPDSGSSGSDTGEISQIGSRLLGALPLFRSFPDLEDQASLLKEEPIKEKEVTEDIVSELKLKNVTKIFADALRPCDPGQKV